MPAPLRAFLDPSVPNPGRLRLAGPIPAASNGGALAPTGEGGSAQCHAWRSGSSGSADRKNRAAKSASLT